MLSLPHTSSDRRNAPLARAGTACKGRVAPPSEHGYFLIRSCGLSLRSFSEGGPALFKKIGTMATDGQPVKTTPTNIAFGPAQRHDNRRRMTLAKSFSRPVTHRPIGRESVSARAGPFR
jgi:hypothetical protein